LFERNGVELEEASGVPPARRDHERACRNEIRDRTLLEYLTGYQEGYMAARKYGRKAAKKVSRAMHERKSGTLRSGRSGRKVKSRKQAIAIGLSEAREAGAKVPRKRKSARKKKSGRRAPKQKS
jgi:hypothetical protein